MRRRAAPKRKIIPDSKYESELVAKFMNQLMVDGKKSIAESIVYGAFEQLEKDNKDEDLVDVFRKILDKVAPVVEVRSRRIGGATYQVPVEVRAKRRTALAMRWLVEAARKRKEKSMPARLAAELKEAKEGRGSAVKKKKKTCIKWQKLTKHFHILGFKLWLGKHLSIGTETLVYAHTLTQAKQQQQKEFSSIQASHIKLVKFMMVEELSLKFLLAIT